MAIFPRLMTGAAAQYGCERLLENPVEVQRFVDGSTQRFARTRVRRVWRLRLKRLSAQEAEAIGSFVAAHLETQEKFLFTDPWNGLDYTGCEVPESGYRVIAEGEHGYEIDILIEQRQV
jgi:hypothetical protein